MKNKFMNLSKKGQKLIAWGVVMIVVSGASSYLCSPMGEYPTCFQFWLLFMSIVSGIIGFIMIVTTIADSY